MNFLCIVFAHYLTNVCDQRRIMVLKLRAHKREDNTGNY